MEYRKHPRIRGINYQADVSDGHGFFSGTVCNFSRFGLCLKEIPNRIDHRARRFSVVFSGDGKNFKMVARSRWTEKENLRKVMGLEILRSPWSWAKFVIAQEPAVNKPFTDSKT